MTDLYNELYAKTSTPDLADELYGKKSVSTGADIAKSAAIGIPKGLTYLAGMPGDIAALSKVGIDAINGPDKTIAGMTAEKGKTEISQFIDPISMAISGIKDSRLAGAAKEALGKLVSLLPTSQGIQKQVEKATGEWYQPETTAGKYAQAVTAGAVGGLAGRPVSMLRNAALGAVGGAAGEAGGHFGGTPGAIIAGVGVPLGIGSIGAMRNNAGQQAARALESSTPADLSAAQSRMNEARRLGIKLPVSEALDNPAIQQLASNMAATQVGSPIFNQVTKNRPSEIKGAFDREILSPISGAQTADQVAKQSQEAAGKFIKLTEQSRTSKTAPYFDQLDNTLVAKEDANSILKQIDDTMAKYPEANPTYKKLAAIRDEVVGNKPVGTTRVTNNRVLDTNKDDIVTAIRKRGGIRRDSVQGDGASMPFRPNFDGAVWRIPDKNNNVQGMGIDEMASQLYHDGYLSSPDDLTGLMDKLADSHMGIQQHFSEFKSNVAEDPMLAMLADIRDSLQVRSEKSATVRTVETNAGKLKATKDTILGNKKLPSMHPESISPQDYAIIAPIIKQIDSAIGNATAKSAKPYTEGNTRYQNLTNKVVAPAQGGRVGQMAGDNPLSSAQVPKFSDVRNAAFGMDVEPSEVLRIARQLNVTDKKAFPSMVRKNLEQHFEASNTSTLAGAAPTAGAKAINKLTGGFDSLRQSNFKAQINGVEQAKGLKKDALYPGMMRVLDVIERTGRIPGIGSQTGPRMTLQRDMGKSALDALNVSQPMMTGRFSQWWEQVNNRRLATALSDPSPDAIKKLQALAKTDAKGRYAEVLALSILTGHSTAEIARSRE